MRRSRFISVCASTTMRTTTLTLLLLVLVAALALARDVSAELSGAGFQWGWAAVRDGLGYASPVASSAVGGYSSLGVSPVAWSASLYLLPSPFSYSWLLGNYTIGAELAQGCTVRLGALRYAVYFPQNSYIQAPTFNLATNFTVVVIYRDLENVQPFWGTAVGFYINSTYTWLINHRGDPRYVKADVCYGTCSGTSFANAVGRTRFVGLAFSASQGLIQVYLDGQLYQSVSFTPSGGGVLYNVNMQVGAYLSYYFLYGYVYAVYVYNRTLTDAEIAAIYTWPLSPTPVGMVLWYMADPAFFNGTHWLDASGNGRHGRVYGTARLVQAVEPLYAASRCGYVDVSARWDGFTASFTYNGQTAASAFAPAYLWFDGKTQYGVVPISFYGWQGLTIEQYIYVPPCKPNNAYSKASMYGNFWSANNTYVLLGTENTYCNYWLGLWFGYNPDGSARNVVWAGLGLGRWQHVVVTFNKTTMTASIYINGTLKSQGAWDYQYTIFDYRYSGFYLGSNIFGTEWVAMAYSYVRIYSRELSPDEVRQNMQSPNSPTTRGLEVWLHWDSFDGTRWLDKSGNGRHATLYGGVRRYPPLGWGFGLFLRDAYPQASPVVVGRLALNWTSAAVATWGPGGFAASAGTWDVSRVSGALVARVDGAYVDAGAMQGLGSASFYLGQQYSLGVSGVWTPSDSWRGWVSLFGASGLWLNITQVGGHGVAAPGQAVRGYSGTYALTYSGGAARLYANGTAAVSWQAQLPSNTYPIQAYLLAPTNSGLRALLYHMWLSPGVALGLNGTSTCGSLRCTPADHSAPHPQEKAYLIDFRWWPPVATWGILQNANISAVRQRVPGQPLVAATFDAACPGTQSAWGPFGEVCVGAYGGQNYVFGVRHVWLSDEAPTCVVSLASAPPTYSSTATGACRPRIHGVGRLPPVLPWQHPWLVNSVPRGNNWVVDYGAPYVDTSRVAKTPYASRACIASYCMQYAYVVDGYDVRYAKPGSALNRTGYVYVFDRFGVSIFDNVALVVPFRNYTLVAARDAHLPGVTATAGTRYYNAWVAYEPKYAVYFPAWYENYVEVGNAPLGMFTIVMVVAKPQRATSQGYEYLWRGVDVRSERGFDIYATLNYDDSTDFCIYDFNGAKRCIHADGVFSDVFNVVAYVASYSHEAIYVNGRLVASAYFSRAVADYILRFGELYSGLYPFYVHAVYVYSRVLTDAEIQNFRLDSPPRDGLYAWYYADPQYFSYRWFDVSGNGRDARIINTFGYMRLDAVAWPHGVKDPYSPAYAYVGPLSSPPNTSVVQAVAAVYVESDKDVAVNTWLPYGTSFDYKTGGYGRGVIPLSGYVGDMLVAMAKVDVAAYGRYAFLVKRDNVHVYSFATELSGTKLDIPIKVPYPGYYTVDVYYNGTKIRTGVYWLDQGGALYLGALGPPVSLIPIQPVQPQTATSIYSAPLPPLSWLPSNLPLPAAVSSNPIEVSAAAALAVALAAAYVTYTSSRRLELGLSAAIVAFFATVSLLLPADFRWMVGGWVAFLVTAAMLLIVYYMTR